VRARVTGATMFHYGWARPPASARTKILASKQIFTSAVDRLERGGARRAQLAAVATTVRRRPSAGGAAVDRRATCRLDRPAILPRRLYLGHVRLYLSHWIERLTGTARSNTGTTTRCDGRSRPPGGSRPVSSRPRYIRRYSCVITRCEKCRSACARQAYGSHSASRPAAPPLVQGRSQSTSLRRDQFGQRPAGAPMIACRWRAPRGCSPAGILPAHGHPQAACARQQLALARAPDFAHEPHIT